MSAASSDSMGPKPETLYDKLYSDYGVATGPLNERTTTLAEIDLGHASVLSEFHRRPGRLLLWIELDHSQCQKCGEYNGRYIQFAFLDDSAGVIGECASNKMLDGNCRYTPDQVDVLHALGWSDPIEGTTPNLHFLATTDDEVAALAVLTVRTLHEVMELSPDHQLLVRFQERNLSAEEDVRANEADEEVDEDEDEWIGDPTEEQWAFLDALIAPLVDAGWVVREIGCHSFGNVSRRQIAALVRDGREVHVELDEEEYIEVFVRPLNWERNLAVPEIPQFEVESAEETFAEYAERGWL